MTPIEQAVSAPEPAADAHNPDLLALIPLGAEAMLDVGCGTGALGAAYRRLNSRARLLGIERDVAAAAVARSRLDEVASVDVEREPWPFGPPNGLDCIVYGDVLQHLRDPPTVIRRHIELLRPDGTMLFCIPNVEHCSVIARLFQGTWRYQSSGLLDAGHLRWFSLDTIVLMLRKVGLVIDHMQARILDPVPTKVTVDLLTPALNNLGIDVADYARRAAPLQYVIRCHLEAAGAEAPAAELHVDTRPGKPAPAPMFLRAEPGASHLESILRAGLPSVAYSGDGPVIHINPSGNLGNRMIQVMAALGLAARVPGCRLSNVSLPEWDLVIPPIERGPGPSEAITGNNARIDISAIAERLQSRALARFVINGHVQHYANFVDRTIYNPLFRADAVEVESLGDEWLVISIRGTGAVEAPNPDYTLLPIEFYKELIAATGLKPVFVGRLEAGDYRTALNLAFPDARFAPSRGLLYDFELLRRATNIVVSVSTLSWLASWLSGARLIVLPLTGMLNPCQAPLVDLLPLDDPRFQFYLFPVNYAVAEQRVEAVHRTLSGLWRRLTPPMIAEIRTHRPRHGLDLPTMRAHFDTDHYLRCYPEVATGIDHGKYPSAFEHWITRGIFEQRSPFPLHRVWYGMTYPLAALEVGQGDFVDFHHHWVAIGRDRGYRRLPG